MAQAAIITINLLAAVIFLLLFRPAPVGLIVFFLLAAIVGAIIFEVINFPASRISRRFWVQAGIYVQSPAFKREHRNVVAGGVSPKAMGYFDERMTVGLAREEGLDPFK